jgi:hypothetical protein
MSVEVTNAEDPFLSLAEPRTDSSVGRLILGRVAGLPSEAIELVSEATRDLLSQRRNYGVEAAELVDVVDDRIFTLVQSSDVDRDLRRGLISVKRALHKHKRLTWDSSLAQRAVSMLPPEDWTAFARLETLTQHISAIDLLLSDAIASDRAGLVSSLEDAVASFPDYLDSLLIAAPDWLMHAKPKLGGKSTSKELKTALLYATRASVKTSPFSGLTTVGVPGTQGSGSGRSRLNLTTALEVLRVLTRSEKTAPRFRYRLGTSRPGTMNDETLFLYSEHVSVEGISWRDDRVIHANSLSKWIGIFGEYGEAGMTYETLTAAIGGDNTFDRFLRLLNSGVIYAVPPWQESEEPFGSLAAAISGKESPIPANELLETQELALGIEALRGDDRMAGLSRLRELVNGWSNGSKAGLRTPSGLLYEDRESRLLLDDPLDVPSVRADLEQLGKEIRPHILRSHIYDFLVDSFVAEFGSGGICNDPLAFMMRLMVDRDTNPPFHKAQAADMSMRVHGAPERAFLPVGLTSAPPSTGVHFQIASDSFEDIAAAEYKLIVNQFGAGTGALLARFTSLLGDGFRDDLSRHVHDMWGDVPCRQLVVWGDSNTAQAESAGVVPTLLLPGEISSPGALPIEETVLIHDPSNGTLSLCDETGTPFGLAYLGLTPQHLMQGYNRLLAVLADPWVNVSDSSDYTMSRIFEFQRLIGPEPLHLPRLEDARIVTRRASWICPIASIPQRQRGESELNFLIRLDDFRSLNGMPEDVFVHQLISPGLPLMSSKKPISVGLASVSSVDVLWRWLHPKATHVRIVESLPGRHEYPQRDETGRRRATEYTTMWSWPKPEAGRS